MKITPKSVRIILIIALFAFGFLSIALLFWLGRDGGIVEENKSTALGKLVKFYLPLALLMMTYYRTKRDRIGGSNSVASDKLIFSLLILFIWLFSPVFLLIFFKIEPFIEMMDNFEPWGDTIGLASLGIYFAEDNQEG